MKKPSLLRDTRASAVVEALVAFPVFFAFFSILVQLIYLELGALATQHAATVAARAAIVVAADDPKFYGSGTGTLSGRRQTEVEEAVKNALRIASDDPKMRVTFSGGFGEGQIVKAHVEFDHPCGVPVGGLLVCGTSRKATVIREASMPSQTAGYTYP
ncbi:MAG TPA: hypothetical protein VLT33_12680 [Labilithrix sp.]|nr:hypothetical protein [Labilithrix sp.]